METELNLVLAILGVLVSLFLTVFGLLIYSGLFTKFSIDAGKPPFENLVIAYRFSRGPYKNAGELFTEVHSLAPLLRTIGVYYDDPQEVAASDLRFMVGAILSEGDGEVDKEYEKLFLDRGYKIVSFPSVSHAIMTTFPFKNTLSIFIAVARVYPQLNEFIKARSLCAHPMIEVYEKKKILFVAPLARQDEFYVTEANEEASDEERKVQPIPPRGDGDDSNGSDKPHLILEEQSLSSQSDNLNVLTSENGSPGEDSAGSSFEELNMES